jgi:hypothetical protein
MREDHVLHGGRIHAEQAQSFGRRAQEFALAFTRRRFVEARVDDEGAFRSCASPPMKFSALRRATVA